VGSAASPGGAGPAGPAQPVRPSSRRRGSVVPAGLMPVLSA